MNTNTQFHHCIGSFMLRTTGCVHWQWQGKSGSCVWPLTVFVNHLFPRISLIRGLWLWNGNYYGRWWMEITFPLIVNPLFSQPPTAHLGGSPPRPPLIELIIARCVFCCVCCKPYVWLGRGFYPVRLLHAPTWDKRNKGLMSNILLDRHPNVVQRGGNY